MLIIRSNVRLREWATEMETGWETDHEKPFRSQGVGCGLQTDVEVPRDNHVSLEREGVLRNLQAAFQILVVTNVQLLSVNGYFLKCENIISHKF